MSYDKNIKIDKVKLLAGLMSSNNIFYKSKEKHDEVKK
jgi:hypothetical protein